MTSVERSDGNAGRPISVMVVDGAELIRTGAALLIGEVPDMEVVADAANEADARRLANGHKPDVAILGPHPPKGQTDGHVASMVGTIRSVSPSTRTICACWPGFDAAHLRDSVAAGLDGFATLDLAAADFLEAIRRVADGRGYAAPDLAVDLVRLRDGVDDGPLTTREAEILRLIALGHTNSEIAERLFLSVRTVETHRSNIQSKLGVTRRFEIVRYALDRGVLD